MNNIRIVVFVLIMILIWMPSWAIGADVSLTWQAPATNDDGTPLTDLAGYRIHCGPNPGAYDRLNDVGNQTWGTVTIPDSEAWGRTYYFAVVAYDTSGNESSFSNEVSHLFPTGPPTEICNGIDDDADGLVDEGCQPYYLDGDGDGYGDPQVWVEETSQPGGYVADDTDCDDTRAQVNPGASEVCNVLDDNCDGTIDEGCLPYFVDADGDGFGDPGDWVVDTTQPPGHTTDNTDCDDTSAAINPQAGEVCNGVDDDCDGTVDEGCGLFYRDGDGDGFGDPGDWVAGTTQPPGYLTDNTDCDDADPLVFPGGIEICGDGRDNDCDAAVDSADAECADSGPNTLPGDNVVVQPVDPDTGAGFVAVTFEQVITGGVTSLDIPLDAPAPPSGFLMPDPSAVFELSTTAGYAGLIETCVKYSGLRITSEGTLRIFHNEDTNNDGAGDLWLDVTTYHDTVGDVICGVADSFSQYGVFEQVVSGTGVDSERSGEGCFIATAAYGSYLDPSVAVLREFRDGFLKTNPVGGWLVRAYYRASPPAARWLAGQKVATGAVRVILVPVVGLAWLLNHLGPGAGILFLGILAMIMTKAVRQWRIRREDPPTGSGTPERQPVE